MSYYDIFTNAMFNGAGIVLGIIIGLYIYGIVNGFLAGLLSVFGKKKKSDVVYKANKETFNTVSEKDRTQELNNLFMDIMNKKLKELEDKENDKNNGSNN